MKIELKKMTEEDLSFLLEVRNHESTRYNLENDSIFDLEQCKRWFVLTKPTWYIINIDDNQVGYFRVKGEEVGCDIHPNHRRKGYARMAYKHYLESVQKATLWVFEDNFAKNLYEDLGFKYLGENKTIRDRNYIKMYYEK